MAMMKEGAVTGQLSKMMSEIIPDEYIPCNGHLLELLDDDTEPHDALEKIMDDTFNLSCTEATMNKEQTTLIL